MCKLVTLFFVLLCTQFIFATSDNYDFIIVGGGTGGGVLASRISENPNIKVLVLEKGPSPGNWCPGCFLPPAGQPLIDISSPAEDSAFSIPQPFTVGRSIRALAFNDLGGNSNIFGTFAIRPSCENINANYPPDLNCTTFRALFKRVEDHYCHYFPENITGISASYCLQNYGKNGPMRMNRVYNASVTDITRNFYKTLTDSYGFFSTDNINDPSTRAKDRLAFYAPFWRNLTNPTDPGSTQIRVGIKTTYLKPEVLARPNLAIKYDAVVMKVLFNRRGRANGVRYRDNSLDQIIEVRAKEGVAVCAGAVQTPFILMKSGVGDQAYLESLGIDVVANNTFIGKGFKATPTTNFNYKLKKPTSPDFTNGISIGHFAIHNPNFTGPVPDIWFSIYTGYIETQAYLADLIGANPLTQAGFPFPYIWISVFDFSGVPEGSISLFSRTSRFAKVDYGWTDAAVGPGSRTFSNTVYGYNFFNNIAETSAWGQEWVDSEIRDPEQYPTIERWIRYNMNTDWHECCSVRMGTALDSYGRVNGVSRLWVVDASMMPQLPDPSMVVVITALGERIADQIKIEID